jgi:hypothetical protein
MMRALLPVVLVASTLQLSRPPDLPFAIQPVDLGASETVAVTDVNRDGTLDIVSGESWYQGPAWTKRPFRSLGYSSGYIDAFSDLAVDVDEDGFPDIVTVSWFARRIAWWRNPGKGTGPWAEATIDSGFPVEFAILADIDNDGQARELLPQSGDAKAPLAWYEAVKGTWKKHVVSPQSYGHGIGAGDVNGDKRVDILTPKGWFEAPADPRSSAWVLRAEWTESAHLGFLHAIDVNDDARPDILTSAGHDYGVFWLERTATGGWTRRTIDDSWSQAHASALVDLNGDGRRDFVTGKRFMAHNGRDPGEKEPLGVYWYESRKVADGGVEWIRHLVDYGGRLGGGMQIPVVDLDGDGDLDLVCAGKSGLFVVRNGTRPR